MVGPNFGVKCTPVSIPATGMIFHCHPGAIESSANVGRSLLALMQYFIQYPMQYPIKSPIHSLGQMSRTTWLQFNSTCDSAWSRIGPDGTCDGTSIMWPNASSHIRYPSIQCPIKYRICISANKPATPTRRGQRAKHLVSMGSTCSASIPIDQRGREPTRSKLR